MKTCQFCAEDIQDEDMVCRHCGLAVQATTAANPTVPASAPPAPQASGRTGDRPQDPIEPYEVTMVVGLSVATLGVVGLVYFYHAARSYHRFLSSPGKSFDRFFWTYVGVVGVTIAIGLLLTPLLIVGSIACIVAGSVLLADVLRVRAVVADRLEMSPRMTSSRALLGFWIAAGACTYLPYGLIYPFIPTIAQQGSRGIVSLLILPLLSIFGIALYALQGAWFFRDHRSLAVAAMARGTRPRHPVPPDQAVAQGRDDASN